MARRRAPPQRPGRWIAVPEVMVVEPGDPILLADGPGGGTDADRRDAQRTSCADEVVLVPDEIA